ncbi:MAG: hypothetical protein DRQ10_06125 [Candidatus Hydrothermota bacterium]|nr:MAG: hypothetical protein DRQ10_06125 [Candidatus Hydrothermae bacterium]
MGKLKILASGDSPQAQAQKRGKLFEELMAEVLQQLGYEIDRIPNTNYAGMEIDIEGRSIATGIPLYAECKYSETNIDSPKLQAFFGKYMTRWLKDNKSHGLFIAIPGLNSHAKGFYNDNVRNHSEITFRILEEDDVIDLLCKSQFIVHPETIAKNIPSSIGLPEIGACFIQIKGCFGFNILSLVGEGYPTKSQSLMRKEHLCQKEQLWTT